MQKRNFLLLLFLTIFFTFKSFAEYNQEYMVFDVYLENEKTAWLVDFTDKSQVKGEVRIPSKCVIRGVTYSLRTVLTGVFQDCTNVTKVVFEDNPDFDVLEILTGTFSNCQKLECVDIPKSAKTIYNNFILECPNFNSLIIRNNTIDVGNSNVNEPYISNLDVTLFVPSEYIEDYTKKKYNDTEKFWRYFNSIESIESLGEEENNGTDGNVKFVFSNYSVEFLNMKVGHQIIYSGCQVPESNNSEYSLENSTITINKSGAVTITALPVDAVTYNDETTLPTLKLGSATLQFPDMTNGHTFVVTVPKDESVKVSNGGTSVYDATNNTHTVTVNDHTNFSAATYSSDQSLVFDETLCQKPSVTVENGHILISGVAPDENINIIDITGRNISLGHRRSISLHPGLYIVMTSQGTIKVRL